MASSVASRPCCKTPDWIARSPISLQGLEASFGVEVNGLHEEAARPSNTSKRIPCKQCCHQGFGQVGG